MLLIRGSRGMQNFEGIWEQVKEIVSEKVSQISYETWIRDLEAIGFRAGAAVLYTSSAYHRDLIKNRFIDVITESFQEVLGRECEVRCCRSTHNTILMYFHHLCHDRCRSTRISQAPTSRQRAVARHCEY